MHLGPSLFLVFYNDLPFTLTCDKEAYADDTTLYSSSVKITELETKLTNNCDNVSLWRAKNKLKFDGSKTHIADYSNRREGLDVWGGGAGGILTRKAMRQVPYQHNRGYLV